MDAKNVCRLCLVSQNEIIEFLGDEGIKLNITKILEQHFWFKVCFFLYSIFIYIRSTITM